MHPNAPVLLNCSNVAALIGRHPFNDRVSAFLSAWRSTDRSSYYSAHERNRVPTVEEERRKVRQASSFLQTNPSTAELLAETRAAIKRDAKPAQAIHTFSSLAADVSTVDIAKETKRVAFTRYGEEKENVIIERVRAVFPEMDVTRHEDMHRMHIGQTRSGRSIVLQGRVDALSKDQRVVFEIKTRVHKLFMEARDYERIQVQSYLQLFPQATKAFLVEGIFNAGQVPSVNVISITRCDDDWMNAAIDMAHVIDTVLASTELQDAIVTTKDENILTTILNNST